MAASDHISSKGMGYRAAGCVVWVDIQLAATCFALRPRVRRENASPEVDLSTAGMQCAGVEVDVCVAPEPHGLVESGSSASGAVAACPVVDPVAIGCGRARSTVTLWSNKKVSFFRPCGGATRRCFSRASARFRVY